ncbi:DUF4214 domain-containing protein [Massilia rhizosphaerae]|uniref:DUF4214 domain-containing protein n=1 Tax=Massilia rhizosphaerae TaxID=2784389 RepID=UPI0018DD2E5F|nr:DUF4214 domain-containing protein [Massilia rhizosphaerae]HWU68301.1 DUF4214 domain-containing protein [Stenotrophobium sp.]
MATTYYNDIQKLYVAYFNRPADPGGLAFWETTVEAAAGSTAAVSAAFAGSDEYKATFANQTNAQIVNTVYMNLFGRAAEDAGKAYWADLLDKGTLTIDAVVTAIAQGAQGSDMTAYNNKVTAAAAFTAAVDTDAEKTGYSGGDANKVAKTFLAGVTDNASLQAATAPAALNTSVAAAVAAGTPFTVAGALNTLNAAHAAVDSFLGGLKLDAAGVATAQSTAVTKIAADLTADTSGASTTLFTNTTSQTVRDALVASQESANADALNAAQKVVSDDNTAISKVTGLTSAESTLTAAQTALTAAQKAETSAHADLVAKEAAFSVNNGGDANTSVTSDGTSLSYVKGGTPVVLATIDVNGKATIADGVDATKYTGLTDLIASFNTENTATIGVSKAQTNVDNAHLGVNLLDVAPDSTGVVGATGDTEAQLIAAISAQINATTPNTVASSATPTVAQIQTELAVLKATDMNAYTSFKALVDAETASGDDFNPLISKLATDMGTAKTASDAIAALAKDVAALQTATANVNTLAGLQATSDAAAKLLTDKGYSVVTLDAAHAASFGTAASDVFVTAKTDATIGAFGLQGTDALAVGKGFTLVQGAIGANGVTANDAALEIFVSQQGGDAQLQIENHAYSSNVAGTAGEVFTIILTGVDASSLHLDSNGIITSSTTA